MSHATTAATTIVVDVADNLTAIVCSEPNVGGYSASIRALPGCHSQGETLDEVRASLREAAEGWFAVAHKDSLSLGVASLFDVIRVHQPRLLKRLVCREKRCGWFLVLG
ncbi:MAG: type II toxin-antitoxin system HicB family antitoxin [Planctomycetota bacterium]|nr:type II toxin-antitoxin system HicB family antitoxin [Planctomycetota bacterium]